MSEQPWAAQRREYADLGLAEADAPADPLELFRRWHADATAAGLPEPNAMVIATVGEEGPSARMVLLRSLTDAGFGFFTNQSSRKGRDLAGEPRCALLFPWHGLERQVRITGSAEVLDRAEVAAYFASRPRGARLGAWASPQSRPVASRAALEEAYSRAEERFGDGEIAVPEEWGGYRVRPEAIEFWQGRPGRMHDRLLYEPSEDGWGITRLAP